MKKFCLIYSFIYLLFLSSAPLMAAKKKRNVSFNFKDAKIRVFVDIISKATKKSFIFNESVLKNKKITIVSNRKFTSAEALKIFSSILYVNGLALVEEGNLIRILERKQTKQNLIKTYEKYYRVTENRLTQLKKLQLPEYVIENLRSIKSKNPISRTKLLNFLEENLSHADYGQYSRVIYQKTFEEKYSTNKNNSELTITRIVEIKYVTANTIRSQLQSIIDRDVTLTTYTENNLIILKDTRERLKEIINIIKELDTPDPNRQVDLIELQYSSAQSMVNILNKIFGYTNRQKIPHDEKPFLTFDQRTNRVIAIGNYQILRKVKDVIKSLDLPFENKEEKISLVQLKYSDSKVMVTLLKQIFAAEVKPNKNNAKGVRSALVPISATNQILIIGGDLFINNVKDMLVKLDTVSDNISLELIPLKNAFSTDIAGLLNKIFKQTAKVNAGSLLIIGDERTNSIIVQTSEDLLDVIKKVINDLDKKIDLTAGDIHVKTLNNAKAEDIAKVLQQVTQTFVSSKKKGASSNQKVTIIPDSTTNSLVIFANKTEYPILENVIKKLDVVRPQVYVEALIMEVKLGKNLNLGIDWQVTQLKSIAGNKTTSTIGSSKGTGQPERIEGAAKKSGSIGILPDPKQLGEYNGTTFLPFSAFIKASQSDSEINILANPQILTLNKQEAEIKVGETRAFQKATVVTNTGATTSFEYKELGVSLKILPQINADNTIQLKIEQTSTSIQSGQVGNTNTPITLNRSIKTEVLVKSGQTIVLGGLIDDQIDNLSSRSPCLGDIPIIGWLFKSNTYSRNKTNLLVFINPRIVRTKEDLDELTKKENEEMKAAKEGRFRENMARRFNMPDLIKNPVLRKKLESEEWEIKDLQK